jgi:sarcosine oxidase subunit alpha
VRRLGPGGRIDVTRRISFRWNGVSYDAFAGDTLASGLLANGVRILGRSVSLGRPRGVMSAGLEEAHAFAQIGEGAGSEPLQRATTVELHDGLVAEGRIARGYLVAGPDEARFDKYHAHCDVLVVGGGPAGLSAALAAASGGARVIVAETLPVWGGAGRRDHATIDGAPAISWVDATVDRLGRMPEVRLLNRTTALFSLDQNGFVLSERVGDHLPSAERHNRALRRLWKVRAKRAIVATGALERPIVFPDNDRPGIMLASAVRTYRPEFGLVPGPTVLFTTNDDAYQTAVDLLEAGVPIEVVDARAAESPAAARARGLGITVTNGGVVVGTEADGEGCLAAVRCQVPGGVVSIPCELLAVSGGFEPLADLAAQRRGGDDLAVVGSAGGVWTLGGCLQVGAEAGAAAADAALFPSGAAAFPPADDGAPPAPPIGLWRIPAADGDESRSFVDLHRDVTVAGVRRALDAGIRSVEHLKRYTLIGTGVEQGRSAKALAGAVAGALLSLDGSLGTSSGRPPTEPVAFAALAGRARGDLFEPIRTTPAHPAHVALGAVFENVGQWKRPRYFPRPGEDLARAMTREAAAVRGAVGIMDASTLGKIDVQGKDAAEFLDRLYVNQLGTLKPGRARYAAMCRLDGVLFDDGVVMRTAEDRFFVTTSTGHAASVMDWMEEWRQTEWPDLEVWTTSITEQWATYAVAGPRAREVVQAVAPKTDLSKAAFGFMAVRPAEVAGIAGQIARVSFSGELAYEVSVPGTDGLALWNALMAAGAPFGITPYGLESLSLLRAEKGFIIVGQDTDAETSPDDAGLGWMISDKDFIGKRSLALPAHQRPDRRRLVGFLPSDPAVVIPEGAHFVADPAQPTPMTILGHVTSSFWSPTLGRSFGLALVRGGRERLGQTLYAPLEDRVLAATIVDSVFYDREGARRDG